MCQKLEVLSPNKKREMSYCSWRKINYLLLKNVDFMINQIQSNSLKNHVNSIANTNWESQFESSSIQLKIPVSNTLKILALIFDKVEFNAVKSLFFIKINAKRIASVNEIEYNYILN